MADLNDQLLRRNLQILNEANNSIMGEYKMIKKLLSKSKDGEVTPEILAEMEQIYKLTEKLHEEIAIRIPDISLPKELVMTIEAEDSGAKFYEKQYSTLSENQDFKELQEIKNRVCSVLEVLESK